MIIHENGKLVRRFIHTDAGNDEGLEEAAMILYRPAVKGKSAIIPQSCAYKYDEPESDLERMALLQNAFILAGALDYPRNARSAAIIVATIQDGLDELVAMPSQRERPTQYAGEATLMVDGKAAISTKVRL